MAADSKSSPSAGFRPGKSKLLLAALCLALAPSALVAQEAGVSMKIDVVAWGDEIGGLSFKSGAREGGITAKGCPYHQTGQLCTGFSHPHSGDGGRGERNRFFLTLGRLSAKVLPVVPRGGAAIADLLPTPKRSQDAGNAKA